MPEPSPRHPPGRIRALVAAPDPAEVGAIASALGAAGHEIVTAYQAEAAVTRLVEEAPDYVVISLPARDPELIGLIARLHARSDAPILVITDARDEERVVAALDAGATGVVPGPIRQLELIARVQAALRRRPAGPALAGGNLDGLEVDGGRHEARVAGRPLALTPTEFELLAVVAARRGGIVDHWKLIRAGWPNDGAVDPETLRTHLNHLNQKLIAAGHPGLRNVRGRGYGLRVEAGEISGRGQD
jgi:two-component system, OmpR family, KDP operon response regulator KdpE